MSKTFHNKTTVVAARPRSKHLRETGGYYTAIAANKNASSAAQTAIKDGMNRYFEEILDSNSAIAGIKALYDHYIIQSPANEGQTEEIKNISEILRHFSLRILNPGTENASTVLVSDITFCSLRNIVAGGVADSSYSQGGSIASLLDVDLDENLANGHVLVYNSLTSHWENRAISTDNIHISLNGSSPISSGSLSFYAPVSSGSAGQILSSSGPSGIPSWMDASALRVSYAAVAASATMADYATSAGYATKDGLGRTISSTYLTAHQDISGKADKVTSPTSGHFAALDANGNLVDSGHQHSDYITSHQDISGKADKVASATSGHFAALDANGNLVDSGHQHSDYITSHQDISGKADKVVSATSGHFAALDAYGNLVDSGHQHSDYLTPASLSGYMTLATDQTVTGKKTFTDGNLEIRATVDSSSSDYWAAYYTRIYNRWWADGTWHGGTAWGNTAIRNSICFPYGSDPDLGDLRTNICVGHIRGGANYSYGFGIGYEVADAVNGNYLQPMMMLRKNGDLYINGNIYPNWGATYVLTSGNFTQVAHPLHGALDSYMWCDYIMAASYVKVGRYGDSTGDRYIYFGATDNNYIQFTLSSEFAFTHSIVPAAAGRSLGVSTNPWSYIYGGDGSFSGNIMVAGNITAAGNVTAGSASDRRLKRNLRELTDYDALTTLNALRPVAFEWNDIAGALGGLMGQGQGFIADEFKAIVPNACRKIWGEYDAIDYTAVVPYLVRGWQLLMERIKVLESRLGRI